MTEESSTVGPWSPRLRDVIGADCIRDIGLFVVTWNQIETSMTLIIMQLFMLDLLEAAAIMSGFSVSQKIETFTKGIERLSDHKDYNTYKAIPSRLLKMRDARDTIVHGQWTFVDKIAYCHRQFPASKPITPIEISKSLVQLEQIRDSTGALFNELALNGAASAALAAWLYKRVQQAALLTDASDKAAQNMHRSPPESSQA